MEGIWVLVKMAGLGVWSGGMGVELLRQLRCAALQRCASALW